MEKGLWREDDLLEVFVVFEHREIDDPAEFEFAGFDKAEVVAQFCADCACELCRVQLFAGGEEDCVARL